MLKHYTHLIIAAAGALLLFTGTVHAQTIAYDAVVQAGNQAFTGNLGLDFNVTAPTLVTSLGVFDDLGNGIVGPLSVAIFDRSTGVQVGPSVTFTAANQGTLTNGDRFLPVIPFVLPVGNYSIVAVGFSNADFNGNSNNGPITASTENPGVPPSITFVGSGRFDNNTTLDFPTTVPPGLPTNVFLAGTFQFAAPLALTLTKAFGAPFIAVGATTNLTLTVTNPNAVALAGVAFNDFLPTGLVIGAAAPVNNCGGNLTATTNSIQLLNGAIGANLSCTIIVPVVATASGVLTNLTSGIASNLTPLGAAATALLTVIPADAFQVRYASNLALGDSVVNITNAGSSSTNLNPLQVANGNICVNAYVFSPDEQLVSCCTCPVTPNGLASLSANNDLVNNTLTPGRPTSVVTKLLASSQPTCNASTVTAASIATAGGLVAFGTTIHAVPVTPSTPAGTLGITETPFTRATLSSAELTRITTLCGFIQITGSGFGVCRSCRLGGLGADRQ